MFSNNKSRDAPVISTNPLAPSRVLSQHDMSTSTVSDDKCVLCTWNDGRGIRFMWVSRSLTMDETAKEAKFIWDIPTDKKCRFYMTRMQKTGEITPRNWFSVIAMGGEIEMTIEDTIVEPNQIGTGEIERLDEPSARQSWQSGDKRTRPGVPDIRDSYMAMTLVIPERRVKHVPQTSRENKEKLVGSPKSQPPPYRRRNFVAPGPNTEVAKKRATLESYLREGVRCDACVIHPRRVCSVPKGHPFSGRCEGCYKSFDVCSFEIANGRGLGKTIKTPRKVKEEVSSSDEEWMYSMR